MRSSSKAVRWISAAACLIGVGQAYAGSNECPGGTRRLCESCVSEYQSPQKAGLLGAGKRNIFLEEQLPCKVSVNLNDGESSEIKPCGTWTRVAR